MDETLMSIPRLPSKTSVYICLNFILSYLSTCCVSLPHGHLEKLGFHREPLGVTWAGKFTAPYAFYYDFVHPEKPLLMKGVLEQEDHPGLLQWTDEFLRKRFGTETVKVERSKIENRDSPPLWLSLNEFLNTYQSEDVYMVQSVNNKMKDLLLVPSSLHCGGFQKVIQDAVLWMGSHHTSSVLHYDPLDNLLCVLNGQKDVVLIDKSYRDAVESNGFDHVRGFSKVDPQKVDFKMFPSLAQVPWHEAKLQEGDCLFIPQGWYHQVTSKGSRHVSMNIWFSHLWWFNTTDCPRDISVYKSLEPISTFGFASPNEAYRSDFLSNFKDEIVTRYNFHELLPGKPSEERASELFDTINEFPDGALSWSELYSFDIDKVLMQFYDLFILNGEQSIAKRQQSQVDNNQEEQATEEPSPEMGENYMDDSEAAVHPLPDHVTSDSLPLPDDSLKDGLDSLDDVGGLENGIEITDNSEQTNQKKIPSDHISENDKSFSDTDYNEKSSEVNIGNLKGQRDEL